MENQSKIVEFGIEQIITEEFAVIKDSYIPGRPLEIQHDLSFGVDKEGKRIYMRKSARFKHDNSAPIIIITIGCYFSINPENWLDFKPDNSETIIIPKDFAIHLAMLVLGTLRGVLHAKTENSDFNRFIIPPFDITSLISDDILFE